MARAKRKSKRDLVRKLDRGLSQLLDDHVVRAYLIFERESPSTLRMGNYTITKTPKGLFNVVNPKGKVLFSDLYSFDATLGIVESLNNSNKKRVMKLLELEKQYQRQYSDLLFASHSYQVAIDKQRDNLYILEDLYEVAKARLERTHQEIMKLRILVN